MKIFTPKRALIVLGTVIVALISVVFFSLKFAQSQPLPQIVTNFTNLDKIEKISKYRSCQGHVTVPQDQRETKRSMKHYFAVKPEFIKPKTVEIYAPYNGYVSALRKDLKEGLEGEIWIRPAGGFIAAPPIGIWQFSVQHIDVREDLTRGSYVKAGELIGYAAFYGEKGNTFDIVYGKMAITPKEIDGWRGPFTDLDSVFNHMSDQVLAQYQKKEAASRGDFIIPQEERDQNPCKYRDSGPYFAPQAPQQEQNDWVHLL